jgi:transketolase
VKPFDKETIVRSARSSGFVVTAEEHNIMGGMGSAVAEILGEECPTLMKRVGTMDTFGESGEDKDLMVKYGLSASNIANSVFALRAKGKK